MPFKEELGTKKKKMKIFFTTFTLSILWYIGAHLEGSLSLFITMCTNHNIFTFSKKILTLFFNDFLGIALLLSPLVSRKTTLLAWPFLLGFCLFQQSLLYGIASSLVLSSVLQSLQLLVFCWKPSKGSFLLYFFPTLYLIHHPYQLSSFTFVLILSLGIAALVLQLLLKDQQLSSLFHDVHAIIWTVPALFYQVYPYLYLLFYFVDLYLKRKKEKLLSFV